MPNHFRFGQFPVEARVVIFGTPTDVESIAFGRNEIRYLVAGCEVGENS